MGKRLNEYFIPGDPSNFSVYSYDRFTAITEFMKLGYNVNQAKKCQLVDDYDDSPYEQHYRE